MTDVPRPHRPARLSPQALAAAASGGSDGTPAAELLERLEDALAALPPAEREAVVTALGYAEGTETVAREQQLEHEQAEALTRSALQLLRGALADVDQEAPSAYPHGRRRRRVSPPPPL